MDQNLAEKVSDIIEICVGQATTVTRYRKPLVGFACAHDPLFNQLKKSIGPHHLHPTELLPEAQTVIAFFLPFSEDLIRTQRKHPQVAKEWALAYIETNNLIEIISTKLKEALAEDEITAVTQKATHNFNEHDLTAMWSHKSVAFIAGLGTFGLNQMLITPAGCSGRFGSLILSAPIPPTPRLTFEYCRNLRDGKCQFCVNNCPVSALTTDGLDKQLCYTHLLEINQTFPDLALCDVCGKCAVGPCACIEA